MRKTSYPLFLISICLLYLTSCISQNKLDYLQDPVVQQKVYELQPKEENTIKPNDELFIKVSSFDDLSFNYFEGDQSVGRAGFSNELSVSLISYSVNDSGYIDFPVVGMISVQGLTLNEMTEKMEVLLKDYFNQPTITIKFAYKKISVLGEVRMPGNYTYSKNHITIFEALSLAGDMTIHGNRNEIVLLRAEGDSITKHVIDIRHDDEIFSKYYFMQPDDVLYVKQRGSARWSVISTPIDLIFSTVTTAILVFSYIDRSNNP
ncbi:MAG: polysaccharide biosynthesis/export family protein [Bacteroidales bacterium]|nr:polysaccharide biosynthesis/export family protein [Bacteroidales bacterium]